MCYPKPINQTPEVFQFDDFELRYGILYYGDKSEPLKTRTGNLRKIGEIVKVLGKTGVCDLGFDIPRGKITARRDIMLMLQCMATGILSVVTLSTFISLPISIPLGAISLAGVSVSGVATALNKKYQKKLTKVTKLVDIVTSA